MSRTMAQTTDSTVWTAAPSSTGVLPESLAPVAPSSWFVRKMALPASPVAQDGCQPSVKSRMASRKWHAARAVRRFVFCRQRSDERLKRGGEQKSVVVLAAQPYSSVLGPLSQHAGPVYFNQGASALQMVWHPPLCL